MATVSDLGRPPAPTTDRLLTIVIPVELLTALDEHLIHRLELPVSAENRNEVLEAALRAHIDFWPDPAPAGAYAPLYRQWPAFQAAVRERAGRVGPAASTDPAERALELARQAAKPEHGSA